MSAGDRPLAPGGALLAAALSAAEELLGAPATLDDAAWLAPVPSTDAARTLQTSARPAPEGVQVAVHARPDGRLAWDPVFEAVARPAAEAPEPAIRPGDAPAAERCYAELEALGRRWPAGGRALRTADRTADRAWGQLADLPAGPAGLALAFEAALQLVSWLVPPAAGGAAILPAGCRRVRHAAIGTVRSVQAELGPAGATGWPTATVRLLDAEGRPVAVLEDLRLRQVEGAALADPTTWCYRLDWVPADAPPAGSGTGTWLVLDGAGGVGEALERRLRAAGCEVVRAPAALPGEPTEALRALVARAAAGAPLAGVVHLGALDAPSLADVVGDAGWTAARAACAVAVAAVRAIADFSQREPGRLWVATRGAQPVGGPGDPGCPVQACVWGLGRSLAAEQPSTWGGLVDLDPDATPEQAADALAGELLGQAGGDQVAFRAGERRVARLVRASFERPGRRVAFRADAAYLVTGGLGDLGLAVARWLAERGAGHLVLMGRTPLPAPGPSEPPKVAAARAAIAGLEATGAKVHVVAADVADPDQVRAALAALEAAGLPATRGVVHAAGVAHLAPAQDLSDADLARAMAAKVRGAAVLQADPALQQLDHLVLFSSGSAVLNSGHLGAYAAGNAFLDALAAWRRHRGLPALAVNWGPWAEVGMAARLETGSRALQAFPASQALALLEEAIARDQGQLAVLPMDWDAWFRFYPSVARAPVFSGFATGAGVAEGPEGDVRAALEDAPAGERLDRLADHVRTTASAVLRTPLEAGDASVPLRNLGMDSLMAMDLRNRLERSLHLSLPATVAWNHPTLDTLATHLALRLGWAEAPSAVAVVAEAPVLDAADGARIAEALGALEALTEGDLARLLSLEPDRGAP